MANEFLNIPLNIKLKHSFFVLNPQNEMFTEDICASNANTKATLQLFTFKLKPTSIDASNAARIQVCPKSIFDVIKNDISYKLLYELTTLEGDNLGSNKRASVKDVFDSIPSILVRQYTLNARINLAMSLLSYLVDGFNSGEAAAALNSTELSITEKLKVIWDVFTKLLGAGEENESFAGVITTAFNKEPGVNYAFGNDREKASIYNMPWTMYYEMITSFSPNVYELPFNGLFTFGASGAAGWQSAGIKDAGFAALSALFDLVNHYLKNVKFDFTPTWDGATENSQAIDVKVDLFNDTIEAMVNNFILVNTLIPSAMSTLYNVFLHSPDLFDVKINGMERLFMCSGVFRCTYAGVVRIPPKSFFDALAAHINPNRTDYIKYLIDNDIIRIPDVYLLLLTFLSLMPNNFNNYIFKHCMNDTIKQVKGNDMLKKSGGNEATLKILDQIIEMYEKGANAAKTEKAKAQNEALRLADAAKVVEAVGTEDFATEFENYATKYGADDADLLGSLNAIGGKTEESDYKQYNMRGEKAFSDRETFNKMIEDVKSIHKDDPMTAVAVETQLKKIYNKNMESINSKPAVIWSNNWLKSGR